MGPTGLIASVPVAWMPMNEKRNARMTARMVLPMPTPNCTFSSIILRMMLPKRPDTHA